MGTDTAIVTYTMVDSKWKSLQNLIKNNKMYDDQECAAAADFASNNATCPDIDGLEKLKKEKFQEVDTWLGTIGTLVAEYAQKDVAKALREKRDTWKDVKKDLDGLHEDVHKHLTLDTWDGEAAQGYKNLLPTQKSALQEMKGLADSQGRACDQMSLINAAMFKATEASLQDAYDKLSSYGGAKIDRSNEEIDDRDYMDAYYCRRSYAAVAAMRSLEEWMIKQQDLSRADWRYAANYLDGDLDKITGATINLQPNGEWPGIGKVVNGEAADTGGAGTGSDGNVGEDNVNTDDGDDHVNLN